MSNSAGRHAAGRPMCKIDAVNMPFIDRETRSTQDMSSGCNSFKSFLSNNDDGEGGAGLTRLEMMVSDEEAPVEDEGVQELSHISSGTVANGPTCSEGLPKSLRFCGRREICTTATASADESTLPQPREHHQRKSASALVRRRPIPFAYKELLDAIESDIAGNPEVRACDTGSSSEDEDESNDSGTHGPPESRRTAYDLGYDGDINVRRASGVPVCRRYSRSCLQRSNGESPFPNGFTGSANPCPLRYSL
eukprot:TRINITY_DN10843_c0_g4_i1.p1 TRINITY_DN10843_c0_g4~~TRINITY_DN10843_c0_g4_i1.p1  ORF type:complete len:250 (+),score=20.74 TRINITY_DN10843_c0_g4_i1:124-873(+)